MLTYDLEELKEELGRDEGRRTFPYKDSEGILTIGVGWNLEANGLPDNIIDMLLDRGIDDAEVVLDGFFLEWRELSNVRQRVLMNMAFNLGNRISGFKKMLAAIKIGDFDEAAVQMLDSKWALQVGPRSQRLAAMMRAG